MSRLTVRLLGRFSAVRGQEPIAVRDHARVQELLAYLLLNRDRPCRREAVAEVLWGDTSGMQARKSFRQTLWRLQSALDEVNRAARPRALLVELEWVSINPAAPLWLDVAVLESASAQCQGVPGRELSPEAAATVRQAVHEYRGDLLESWPHEWCLFERERLRATYLQLLDKLMDNCEAHEAFDEAVECGTQILRHERARERTHRQLMRLHYLAGDRSEALRQYTRCTEALRDELDARPSERTSALHERILADRLEVGVLAASVVRATDIERDLNVEAVRELLLSLRSHLESTLQHLDRLANADA